MKITTIFLLSILLTSPAYAMTSQLQQGGFYVGQAPPGVRVFYADRPLELTADRRYLLGFGRDSALEQKISLVDAEGRETQVRLTLKPRNYKIERINGIKKEMMEPSAKTLERIGREAEQAYLARQNLSRLSTFEKRFIWPLKGRISGVYGSQRILNGEPRRPHFGIDIAAPKGTPVVAPADGIVRLAHPGMFFSGKTLIIDHGFGLSSSFLHLSKILVKEGQQVKQGGKIGQVGATGRVTGPHLDWRMNWFDQRLDPALWVPAD